MRKILFISIIFINIVVFASGGTLKQGSIIECNGEYYGNHGSSLHWHKAKIVNGKWVSDGEEVEVPSCYIKPVNILENVSFSSCIDGDTAKFIIGNTERTVRFLAINTPEVASSLKNEEPFGKEASEFTCNTLKKAKKIVLEYDQNSDKEDKYGRVLAFVFVDDELLESLLISNGYAKIDYVYGDYNHLEELRLQENAAKEKKIGIWNDEEALPDIPSDSTLESNMSTFEKVIYTILTILYFIYTKLFA